MKRDEAVTLLRGGLAGVEEWNVRRSAGEAVEDLRGADLSAQVLDGARLDGLNLEGARFNWAKMSGVQMSRANLVGAQLTEADLRSAVMNGTFLRGAQLGRANLRGATLLQAELDGAYLLEANLREADLTGSNFRDCILFAADLEQAKLDDADLGGATLTSARLRAASLKHAMLQGANITYAELSRTNLIETTLSRADLSYSDLSHADLTGSNLTFARMIGTNLAGASMENATVTGLQVESLSGLPVPPLALKNLFAPGGTLQGEVARSFFVRPESVEIVLDRPISATVLGAYHVFVGECQATGDWPTGVVYWGGRVELGQTTLSFRAARASDVIRNLPLLLRPFRLSAAVDWGKLLRSLPLAEVENVVGDMMNLPMVRSRVAEHLQQFEGFADASPRAIRVANQIIEVKIDAGMVRSLPSTEQLPLQLTFIEGGQHMSEGDNIHIGGDAVGAAVGRGARVNARDIAVYKNAVDQSQRLDADLKAKLKDARDALEKADLPGRDKDDVADDLGKLTDELRQERPEAGRVRRLFEQIQKLAPPVASILASAAALAKAIAGG